MAKAARWSYHGLMPTTSTQVQRHDYLSFSSQADPASYGTSTAVQLFNAASEQAAKLALGIITDPAVLASAADDFGCGALAAAVAIAALPAPVSRVLYAAVQLLLQLYL